MIICQLNTPIVLPDLVGWGVSKATPFDEDSNQIELYISFHNADGVVLTSPKITVTNTTCTKIYRNPTPSGYGSFILSEAIEVPGAFDDLLSAWTSAESKEDRIRALAETLLILGLVDTSLSGKIL